MSKLNFSRLSPEEVREFLNSKGVKRVGAHSMTKHICHWPYCIHCGLVGLKNDVTRKALRQQCISYE